MTGTPSADVPRRLTILTPVPVVCLTLVDLPLAVAFFLGGGWGWSVLLLVSWVWIVNLNVLVVGRGQINVVPGWGVRRRNVPIESIHMVEIQRGAMGVRPGTIAVLRFHDGTSMWVQGTTSSQRAWRRGVSSATRRFVKAVQRVGLTWDDSFLPEATRWHTTPQQP
jgi:hypothetical protein